MFTVNKKFQTSKLSYKKSGFDVACLINGRWQTYTNIKNPEAYQKSDPNIIAIKVLGETKGIGK